MINIPKSSFTRAFVRLNGLDELGFVRWIFMPGTEFGAQDKWWVPTERRSTPHEGLDICSFEGKDRQVVDLAGKNLVPAMYKGTVIKIFKDLLGFSILVAHDFQDRGKTLYSIYAHTQPFATLKAGTLVNGGDPVATICPTEKKKMPPHLHLSVMWVHDAEVGSLNWQTINTIDSVIMCNPHDFL